MSDDRPDEARENFNYIANEYAQGLQALNAIEDQSTTRMLLGVGEDLRSFIDQFLEMAQNARNLAIEKNEPNFAEWFAELIEKAEALRGTVTQ